MVVNPMTRLHSKGEGILQMKLRSQPVDLESISKGILLNKPALIK